MLPPGIKIFIAIQPVDMRMSHDGLSVFVQTKLQLDSLLGPNHSNKNHIQVLPKILLTANYKLSAEE
jgi:hypothetical protein